MASNPVVADHNPVPIGRRGAARARLHANAQLVTTTGKLPVVLRNLSCTGAMAEGANLPPVGRDLLLQRGDMEVLATVVWQSGSYCGLDFYDPIDHDQVVIEARRPPEDKVRTVSRWDPIGIDDVRTSDDWKRVKAETRWEHGRIRRLF
jgi:hypothetical protein